MFDQKERMQKFATNDHICKLLVRHLGSNIVVVCKTVTVIICCTTAGCDVFLRDFLVCGDTHWLHVVN